jgi:hypothetical protein
LSKFSNAAAFASWLGLCRDNRISGGKILSVATRKVKNRVVVALVWRRSRFTVVNLTSDSTFVECELG